MATTELQSTKVITGKVRLSYVHIFEPSSIDGTSDAKYSVSVLVPKTDKKTLKAIKAAIDAAKIAGKTKLADKNGKIPANIKTPLRDGDTDPAREDDPDYENIFFFNATSKGKPGVVDQQCNPIMDSTDVYSGCYARVSVNFYAFNTSGNKGIAAGLNNIQKWADGDPLGGRANPEDEFELIPEDKDDDDEDFMS